jgi:hypothetical protein
MNTTEMYEIEEFFNDETEFTASKPVLKSSRRKWREIENYQEKQRLRRELQEYSQYGL